MKPFYESNGIEVYCGDNREVLPQLNQKFHACVTDPPYGYKFMNSKWDYSVPSKELWATVLDSLLPGAHLLAACGTRTQHRMAVNIEDGGFEIKDLIMWHYGSGFPKSMNISKAIDKAAGMERKIIGVNKKALRNKKRDTTWTGDVWGDNGATITEPATDLAKKWDGWGTALKPATEIFTMARRPIEADTVASNVIEYGTGALNIEACRVGTEPVTINRFVDGAKPFGGAVGCEFESVEQLGRWPANIVHDGSEEVLALFPESAGQLFRVGPEHKPKQGTTCYGDFGPRSEFSSRGDSGSAARFFYCAKSSKAERGEFNNHATVKPLALMRYLIKLITPPGGVVLDPFGGSGSTAVAARDLGFRCVIIELEEKYCEIIVKRLERGGQKILDFTK